MPAKGSKKATNGQEGDQKIIEMTTEKQTEKTTQDSQVPENLAERLSRIEAVLGTIAARTEPEAEPAPKRRVPSPTVMTTRQKTARAKASGSKKGYGGKKQTQPIQVEDEHIQDMETENEPETSPQQTPDMTSNSVGGHLRYPYVNTPFVNTPAAAAGG